MLHFIEEENLKKLEEYRINRDLEIKNLLLSIGFVNDIHARSYKDPISNYGLTFHYSAMFGHPIFLPYIIYHDDNIEFEDSDYIDFREFFDGISESIRVKLIFHLDIFKFSPNYSVITQDLPIER